LPLLRTAKVLQTTGLSKTTLYKMIATESFPRPIKLGARAVAWPQAWIDAFLASRAASVTPNTAAESTRRRRRLF